MKAMVLAAGLGERMRPLTLKRAKSSLPLFNKPFILHAVDYLRRFGIRDIAINLHHQPDSIKSLSARINSLDVNVLFSFERDILGTAGGIKKLENFFGSEPFVLMNSDFVADINLDEVIEYHDKEKPLATLTLQKSETSAYSKVKTEADGNIKAIGDPEGEHIFCGLHIVEPEVLKAIRAEEKVDINKDVYSSLLAQGLTIKGYEHKGFWFEFGNLQRYLQGHIELAQRGANFIEELLNIRFPDHFCFASQDFNCSNLTKVKGFLFVGEKCRLEKDVSIGDSILHDNVVISQGAEISRCIIGEDVIIPEGEKLHGSAVVSMSEERLFLNDKEEYTKKGPLLIRKFHD